jgi:hypothetical protein
MTNLNRILAIFFFVLAGVAVLLGLLGLPPEGFFFALPHLLFMVAAFLALLGGLHLLAVRGFRTHAPWRWIAQAMPVILLLVVILSFLTW